MKSPTTRLSALFAASLFATGSAFAQSCQEEVGTEEAQTYVDQCLEGSPATRPPCNAESTCQLIRDEIARGCRMLENDAPEFCSDH